MKLLFSLFLSVFIAVSAFAEVNILCTTTPVTLLTKAVIDGINGYKVTTMLPAAVGCPHDYALTPQDMRKLAKADVIIINGLGMEDFLEGAIPRVNRKALVIDSSKGAKGLLPFRDSEEECSEHGHEHRHEHKHEHAWNEHLFAAPGTAAELVRRIAEELSVKFPEDSVKFSENAKKYQDALLNLDKEYRAFGKSIPAEKRNIAVQHGIFDYLASALGLHVTEYLQLHTGSEPSAAQIREMTAHLKRHGASAILAEKNYPSKVTDLVSRETKIPVLTLFVQPESGATPEAFLKLHRDNLEAMKAFYRK